MSYERGDYRLVVGTPPDRKDISVEIWIGDAQFAEVYDDPGYPVVEFYDVKKPRIVIKTADMLDLLNRAVAELADRRRK